MTVASYLGAFPAWTDEITGPQRAGRIATVLKLRLNLRADPCFHQQPGCLRGFGDHVPPSFIVGTAPDDQAIDIAESC